MADDPGGSPVAFDVWRVATPLQFLQLMQRLGVPGRVMARQIGVTPAAISFWLNQKRSIPPGYTERLRFWAQKDLEDASRLNQKEADGQPTADLAQMVRAAFTGIWARWQGEVLYEADTLHQAIQRQYEALGAWVRQERYSAEDVESVQRGAEALVHLMTRVLALQGEPPSAEDALACSLQAAHDTTGPVVLSPEERAIAEAEMPARRAPEAE
jgi:hypothetical protein